MPELISFLEQTAVVAKDQPQYQPLPAYRYQLDPQGRLVCCWKFSAEELLEIAANDGKVWHHVLTFNGPLQPQLLSVQKPTDMAPHVKSPCCQGVIAAANAEMTEFGCAECGQPVKLEIKEGYGGVQ